MDREKLEEQPREKHADDLESIVGDESGALTGEDSKTAATSGWFLSIGVHGLFALIFSYAVWATAEADAEYSPMKVTTIDPLPKQEESRYLERQFENKVEINIATEADVAAPINQPEVPIEVENTPEGENDVEQNKGREEALSSSETGATGAFMAIGAGGGSAGMFGSRSGGSKRRALAKGGGTKESESAVDAALRWFRRHQSPNGMWDSVHYPVNCTEDPKCEPGTSHPQSDANVAMTGYAVLCFLGAGYEHQTPNRFRVTVKKGLDYLRSVQHANGRFGMRNYEHSVATMALAEAYAMTNDPDLKQPAQKGLNFIAACQANGGSGRNGLGWDYYNGSLKRNDASISGWCVMALKSGTAGGLDVGNSMVGAKNWLQRAWQATNPDFHQLSDPYSDTSTFAYTWDATTDQVQLGAPGESCDLAPVGALCAVFLGHQAGDIMLETLCNHVMAYQFPRSYPCNTYFMYYNTLAIFQAGGKRWDRWNKIVRDMLVNAQRKGDDCFAGSWDFEGTVFPGHTIGRVLSTAYCCLSLEVYYRYKQIGGYREEPPPSKPKPVHQPHYPQDPGVGGAPVGVPPAPKPFFKPEY